MGPSGVEVAVQGLECSCSNLSWYLCVWSETVRMRFLCCFCKMQPISGYDSESSSFDLFHSL